MITILRALTPARDAPDGSKRTCRAGAAQEIVDRSRDQDPSRYVLPPVVQALLSEMRSWSRKKARRSLGHVQLDETVAEDEERLGGTARGCA